MNGASRNKPCPCGSGKKYKHCCYSKDIDTNLNATRYVSPTAKGLTSAERAELRRMVAAVMLGAAYGERY